VEPGKLDELGVARASGQRYRRPVRFGVLGPLEVSDGDGPLPLGGPKQRLVLAHLVLSANQVVPADHLIDAVWGEELPETPKAALQVIVSRLRSALGTDAIEGRPPGYLLRADPDEVDSLRFERLLSDVRRGTFEPRTGVRTLAEALELWRGPALADLAAEASLTGEIARLEELRLQATEEKIEGELELGRHGDVVGGLEALAAAHPLRERVWGHLMLALYRSGRQADALKAFQRAREVLADELGIDPTAELQTLHQRILRHDPELDLQGEPLRGYRLLERIGEGSFGVVHRAIQPHVGREVAVKAINPELANDPEFVRRFEAEAQIVARLEHPHIVPLYDYWRDPDGAYLVMRYLSHGSLRQRLEGGRAIAPEELADLVDQVSQALAAAHRQGIVHRDVKPENVLLDEDGNAYLTDFGIAKDISDPRKTRTGPLGTPAYTSPEQIRGETVSPRTDVYALGVMVFEGLTGRHPFPDGSIATLLERTMHEPLPSVRADGRTLPAAVDDVIAQATAKDPALRFPDAPALAVALRTSLGPDLDRVAATEGATNPFKGLRPFVEADAVDFFGREALVDRLVARLREDVEGSRFLAVVGPSGSGKSSVVRAGLVPALRGGAVDGSAGWFFVEMAPGPHPLEELEAAIFRVAVKTPPSLLELLEGDEHGLHRAVQQALPADDSQLVLVLDQLEEVFTLVEDERERRRFLDGVRSAVADPDSRLVAVATLRADFYDRPLAYSGFAELMRGRTEPVVPLLPQELERAIAGPAENVGVTVEPALVAQVVADVAEQPGALPLLQYAMTEVFDGRGNATLSAQAYREIGGVSGALARRAEQLYEGMNTPGKQAAEQLFLRLVALGEGSEDTRRRVARSELDRLGVDGRALNGVIEAYGRHRLLSLDRDPDSREPTVEVAHEVLLREWGRLRDWINSARDDLRTERRLAAAAAEWEAAGRDPSFLLRGSRLEQLSTWGATTTLSLAQSEREFLDTSLQLAEAERATEAERVAREQTLERRSLRRLRTAVAVFAVAALVAAGLTVVATNQSERAETESRIASARELAAASIANLEIDPQRSILLAIEAVELTRSVDGSVLREAEEALHRAVVASRIVTSIPGVSEYRIGFPFDHALDWGPSGLFVTTQTFAAEGRRPRGVIDLRDPETGSIVRTLPGHDGELTGAAFSADGSMLATTGTDGLKVWDLRSGTLLENVEGGERWVPSFSADGSLVAAVSGWNARSRETVEVVDLRDGTRLSLPAPRIATGAELSPDGRTIAAVGKDARGDLSLIDIENGTIVRSSGPGRNGLTAVSWSPDGRYVAAGGWDPSVPVWDATGTLRFVLPMPSGFTHRLDWSPDSSRLVTGGSDGTARVWEITDVGPALSQELSTDEGVISGVAFSPDGNRVLTGTGGSAAIVFDVGPAGDAEVANIPNAAGDVMFSPAGRVVIASGLDGTLTELDVDTREQTRSHGSFGPTDPLVSSHELSPDGAAIVIEEDIDGEFGPTPASLVIRDVATGSELFAITGDAASSDWSPDGGFIAVATSGWVEILDRTWRRVARFGEEGSEILSVGFGPDGLVAINDQEGETEPNMKIWDWRRDEIITEIENAFADGVINWDRSGSRIAIGGDIWDAETGDLIVSVPFGGEDIAFSPDGSRFATGGDDGVIQLFDASGEQLVALHGHDAVGNLVFSPDGTMLASEGDGIVRIWALEIADLLEIARAELTRTLTDEECRQYLHVETCPAASST